MTDKQVPLDTIKFTMAVEETIVNDTVKIVAQIAGMVTQEISENNLRSAISDMMNRFILADWQFAGLNRSNDASGFERISLVASARVPESENRALDKRRLAASRPDSGLSIASVQPDVSSPARIIAETETKLRIKIIEAARVEAKALSEAAGRTYSIHRIVYDTVDHHYDNNRMRASASAASMKTSYGSGFTADSEAIGNAQKLSMTAEITLAAS